MNVKELVKKGTKFLEVGEYEKALEYYEKAIDKEPKSDEAWYKMGNTYGKMRVYREALKAYRRAISINPEDTEVWFEMGNILSSLKRYNEALKAYDTVIKIINRYEETTNEMKSKYINALYGKGNVFNILKRYNEALKAYDDVIDFIKGLKPDEMTTEMKLKHAKAWYEKGNVLGSYKEDEKDEKALKAYGESVKIYKGIIKEEKDNIEVLIGRKNALLNLLKYEKLKYYKEQVKKCKELKEYKEDEKLECAKTWYQMGNIHFILGRYEEQLEADEEAIRIYEELKDKKLEGIRLLYADALNGKGAALGSLMRYKEALETYKKVINILEGSKLDEEKAKIISTEAVAFYNKGIILFNLKEYNKVLKASDESIEKFKKLKHEKRVDVELIHARTWYNKGVALSYLEKNKKALKAYEKAVKICEEANRMNEKLKAEEKEKLKAEEKEKLKAEERKKLIRIDYARAWNNKGDILHRLGEYEKASKAYKRAIEINPDYALPYIGLGQLLFEHGNLEDASEKIEKSFEITEENFHGFLLNGRIEIERGNYDRATNFFEKATLLNLGDPRPLLWTAYARYLKAEFASIKNIEQEKESTGNSSTSGGEQRGNPPGISSTGGGEQKKRSTEKNANKSSVEDKTYKKEIFTAIRDLEKARDLSGIHMKRELRECILYFLGYFYYRVTDIYTAKERLEECVKLESRREKIDTFFRPLSWEEYVTKVFYPLSWAEGLQRIITIPSQREKLMRFIKAKSKTERRARELLNHIWKYKLKPAWWRWWWTLPMHRWLKRTIFVILLLPIFSLLFNFLRTEFFCNFTPESIFFIKEESNIYLMIFFESISSIKENLDIYLAVVSISIFLLLLPTMEKIKVKEIDVEMSSLPSFEPFISPSMIEEKLGDFSTEELNSLYK